MTTQLTPHTTRTVAQSAVADLADVPATSRWVHSGGVRLHVLDYGGDKPPLLMIPGITNPAVAMDFVAQRLTDIVRPIALDVRGRGLSDIGDSYSMSDYAADVAAVVSELGLRAPILLGHSMGARIAAVAAVEAAASGGDIAGTILVDPPLSGPGRGPYAVPRATVLAQLDQAYAGVDAADMAALWPTWPQREQQLRSRWLATCDRDAVAATHSGFETEDFFEWWPQVPAPTYFVHGADSPVVSAAGAAEAAAANSEATISRVPGAGHMVFWDAPEAGIGAVRDALLEILARRTA